MSESQIPFQLAYESALRAIEDQSSVTESLRSRAGTVFAATALVTSFLGGFALTREEDEASFELVSLPGLAVAIFAILALLTLAILWPYRLRFSISARDMLSIVESRRDTDDPVRAIEAYRELALRYEQMYDYNSVWIRQLFWCFRVAIVCLVGEVVVWIAVLEEIE